MKYGYHHSRSADALAWLLSHQADVAADEIELVLPFRLALLGATSERCDRAVRGADAHQAMFGVDPDRENLTTLTRSGPLTLSAALGRYPRFQSHAIALSDALSVSEMSPGTLAWREAARRAVLATEALLSAPDWTREPARAWQATADVADTTEAIASLDKRLIPALPGSLVNDERAALLRNDELHMVARLVGGLARSGDLDAGTDGIRRQGSLDHPVPLRGLEDLVPATQTLARLVDRHPFSVKELRHFALMQAEHADACARLVTAPGLHALRRSFRERDLRYRQLAGATARNTSIIRSEGRPALVQLYEIRRMLETQTHAVPMGALAEYDAIQPEISRALNRSVNRAIRSGWYLVVDDRHTEVAWRRSKPGSARRLTQCAERLRGGAPDPDAPRDLNFESGRLLARDLGADQRELYDAERSRGRHILELLVSRLKIEQTEPSAAQARDRLRVLLDRQPYRRPAAPNHTLRM